MTDMNTPEKHCETCICGRRARVQAGKHERVNPGERGYGPGTVAWSEHLLAWSKYAAEYGADQSAERMAERGGFGYREMTDLLGREPETWEPR